MINSPVSEKDHASALSEGYVHTRKFLLIGIEIAVRQDLSRDPRVLLYVATGEATLLT